MQTINPLFSIENTPPPLSIEERASSFGVKPVSAVCNISMKDIFWTKRQIGIAESMLSPMAILTLTCKMLRSIMVTAGSTVIHSSLKDVENRSFRSIMGPSAETDEPIAKYITHVAMKGIKEVRIIPRIFL